MFELSICLHPTLSLFLSPSLTCFLSLPLKFIQGLFSLWAFLTWPFHVGVYQSSFYDCINFGLQKELSLPLKKDKKASPADHLIISCSPLCHSKCSCQWDSVWCDGTPPLLCITVCRWFHIIFTLSLFTLRHLNKSHIPNRKPAKPGKSRTRQCQTICLQDQVFYLSIG